MPTEIHETVRVTFTHVMFTSNVIVYSWWVGMQLILGSYYQLTFGLSLWLKVNKRLRQAYLKLFKWCINSKNTLRIPVNLVCHLSLANRIYPHSMCRAPYGKQLLIVMELHHRLFSFFLAYCRWELKCIFSGTCLYKVKWLSLYFTSNFGRYLEDPLTCFFLTKNSRSSQSIVDSFWNKKWRTNRSVQ